MSIFVSYPRELSEHAEHIRDFLKSEGFKVFVDTDPQTGIPGGERWKNVLYQEIRNARALLVIYGRAWNESKWCLVEWAQADSLGKYSLVLQVDDEEDRKTSLPENLDTQKQAITLQYASEGSTLTDDCKQKILRSLTRAGVPRNNPDSNDSVSPYRGLDPLNVDQSHLFFGREAESGAVIDKIRQLRDLTEHKFGLVVGPSGSGKSSLLAAGVASVLVRDPAQWHVVGPFLPGDDPFTELKAAWKASLDRGVERSPKDNSVDPELRLGRDVGEEKAHPLVEAAAELRAMPGRDRVRLVVLVDQFEELLNGTELAEGFFEWLMGGVAEKSVNRPLVVVSMRSEFLTALQSWLKGHRASHDLLPLAPLSNDRLGEIIEGPAAAVGLRLEAGLVPKLVSDASDGTALPLLAFALEWLYAEEQRLTGDEFPDLLRLETYSKTVGGVAGVIQRQAEEFYPSDLSDEDEKQVRQFFVSLARYSTDASPWTKSTSIRMPPLDAAARRVADRFVTARLLVTGKRKMVDDGVEVAHESIFAEWDRYAQWLDGLEGDLQTRDRLIARADEAGVGGPGGVNRESLLRGAFLDSASELLGNEDVTLDAAVRGFVEESVAERDRRQREELRSREEKERGRRFRARALTTLVVLMVIALVAGGWGRAESLRRQEQEAIRLALADALESDRTRSMDPALSLQLAVRGVNRVPKDPLRVSLDALVDARIAFESRSWQPLSVEARAHRDLVVGLTVDSDGRAAWTAGNDDTVARWEVDDVGRTITEVNRFEIADPVSLAASPEGSYVAVVDRSGYVHLLTSEGLLDTKRVSSETSEMAIDGEGTLLAIGNEAGELHLVTINLRSGGPEIGSSRLLDTISGRIESLAFWGIGAERTLIAANSGGDILLYPTEPGGEPVALDEGVERSTRAMDVSADQKYLATGHEDGVLRVWDLAGRSLLCAEAVADVAFTDVDFGPNRQVLTSNFAGELAMWRFGEPDRTGAKPEAECRQHLQPLLAHAEGVGAGRHLPESTVVISVGEDGVARLWEPGQRLAVASGAGVFDAWSTHLVTVGAADTVVRFVPLTQTAPELRAIDLHTDGFADVAVSQNGEMVVSGGLGGELVVRRRGAGPEKQSSHPNPIYRVAAAADGSHHASADGQSVIVGSSTDWNLAESTPDVILQPTAVAFGSDAQTLYVGNLHGRIFRWNWRDGGDIAEFEERHNRSILDIDLAGSVGLLVTGSRDGTLSVHEGESLQTTANLSGHSGPVSNVDIDASGSYIVSVDSNGAAILWQYRGSEWQQIGQAFSFGGMEIRDARLLDGGNAELDLAILTADGSVNIVEAPFSTAVACTQSIDLLSASEDFGQTQAC